MFNYMTSYRSLMLPSKAATKKGRILSMSSFTITPSQFLNLLYSIITYRTPLYDVEWYIISAGHVLGTGVRLPSNLDAGNC